MSSEEIVNTHDTFMKSFGIELSDDDKGLPYLYWTPKLHKSPVKHRFIPGSSKCTTKQLSSLLTKIITVIKTGLEKYCSIKTSHTGVNNMWILKNSTNLLSSLGHLGVHNNNKKRSHTQLDSRKQVIAFQARVITINIKEAQHPLK